MSKERRISPRKECGMPLRFRVLANGTRHDTESVRSSPAQEARKPQMPSFLGVLDGQAVNLSECGMYFRSRQQVNIGDPLEMYFTIPQELTGRDAEQVRCTARVVRVHPPSERQGTVGVGVAVERFETMEMSRNWGN